MELCKGVLLTVLGSIGSVRSVDDTALSGPRAVRADSTEEGACEVLSMCFPSCPAAQGLWPGAWPCCSPLGLCNSSEP